MVAFVFSVHQDEIAAPVFHSPIESALQFVDASDRETWLRMGMAIKSEMGDSGFDLWETWSQQADSYNARDARDVWKSIRAGGGITIGTLFHEAKTNGWRDDRRHPKPSPEAIAERQRKAAERAKKEEAEIARERANTAAKAAAILQAATEANPDHPYLVRKQVSPAATLREIDATAAAAILGYAPKSGGEPLTGRLLVVPVRQGDGISTLELIDGDGRKSALTGRGTKSGGYWANERLPDGDGNGLTLLIGEGVATVLSASETTGHPAIAALSAGNLLAVAKAMRERYPAAALVMLADLVKTTGEPNPHAIEAAQAVGGTLAVPDFGKGRNPGATDFNDMAALHGLDAVKAAIDGADFADAFARYLPSIGYTVTSKATSSESPDSLSATKAGCGGYEDASLASQQAGCGVVADKTTGGGGADNADAVEIARLAALKALDYDRQRGAAAKALGVRSDTLDKLVKEARGETAEDSSGGKALSFREVAPWAEPVAVDALLDDLQSSVQRFLSLPEHAAPAIALWVAYSHCVVLYGHIAPTLAITSPEKRCGKSTLLGWLYRVVEKPLLAANITAAAIFRTIDAYAPTLLIDEADSFLGETGDELRGILNSGHTRDTAFVIRVCGDDLEPRQFSTWGAKAVALIGKLDGRYSTLADRSIEIQLRRRLPTDTVEKLRHAETDHFERLAGQCVRFAQDHGAAIGKARPDIPDSLHDRAADNWEPLLAIADLAGGRWPRLARSTAMALSGGADDDSGHGIGVQLLADLRRYFEDRAAASYATVDILNHLISIEDAPWSSYARGKPMTARHLSRVLKPYGIRPKNLWQGGAVPKGYEVSDFKDAFARYLPSIRYSARSEINSGESPDSVSAMDNLHSGYANASLVSPQADSSGIADKTTDTGREPGFDDDVADDDDWEVF